MVAAPTKITCPRVISALEPTHSIPREIAKEEFSQAFDVDRQTAAISLSAEVQQLLGRFFTAHGEEQGSFG
jgi:hypothetical protein